MTLANSYRKILWENTFEKIFYLKKKSFAFFVMLYPIYFSIKTLYFIWKKAEFPTPKLGDHSLYYHNDYKIK